MCFGNLNIEKATFNNNNHKKNNNKNDNNNINKNSRGTRDNCFGKTFFKEFPGYATEIWELFFNNFFQQKFVS